LRPVSRRINRQMIALDDTRAVFGKLARDGVEAPTFGRLWLKTFPDPTNTTTTPVQTM
jgi:hypothetical protein